MSILLESETIKAAKKEKKRNAQFGLRKCGRKTRIVRKLLKQRREQWDKYHL